MAGSIPPGSTSLQCHMISEVLSPARPHLEKTDLTPAFKGGNDVCLSHEFRNPLESFISCGRYKYLKRWLVGFEDLENPGGGGHLLAGLTLK